MGRRKCVIILLDGLGDRSYASLQDRTPLQAAQTPNLDRLARDGGCGLFHATHLGQPLPSEDAHFALFGYAPEEFPGRGPLEALGAKIEIAPDDVAILAHLAAVRATREGLLLVDGDLMMGAEEADALFAAVNHHEVDGLRFRFVRTHAVNGILVVSGGASPFVTDTDPILPERLLIEPQPWRRHAADPGARRTAKALKAFLQFARSALAEHPVNQARGERGEPLANGIVTQRSGRLKPVPTLRARYGLRGLMITSGIMLPGLAAYIGMDCHKVSDSDQPDEDLAMRIRLAQGQLGDYDLIHVHTKIPDQAAHSKDPLNKVQAIEACDRGIGAAIDPLIHDPDVVVVVTADHSTPSGGTMIHSGEPVPLLFHGTGVRRDQVNCFDEIVAAGGALSLVRGRELVYLILNYLDRAKLHGLMDTPDDQPYWPGDYQPYRADEPAAAQGDVYDVGIIHGRFQVLHTDHVKYLLAGKERCRHLVVGITNAEPDMIQAEAADRQRSTPLANPLTYYERYQLVRCALMEAGVALQDFSIVPLPISQPERYRHYVPLEAVFFLSIYDGWGQRKRQYFESHGLTTCVLREVTPEEKGISGTDVRQRILSGEAWRHLVPATVAALCEKWNLAQRLRDIERAQDDG